MLKGIIVIVLVAGAVGYLVGRAFGWVADAIEEVDRAREELNDEHY